MNLIAPSMNSVDGQMQAVPGGRDGCAVLRRALPGCLADALASLLLTLQIQRDAASRAMADTSQSNRVGAAAISTAVLACRSCSVHSRS